MKRVFLIHGWDGNPNNHWFPWLKKELKSKGFEVITPAMPNKSKPKIETWVPYLAEQVGKLDKDTYFIGHSIGCQTILRYLERTKGKCGGCIFVAGFFTLNLDEETEDDKAIAKPWLETPINFTKVKEKTNNFFAIFSDDDEVVPTNNAKMFKKNIGAKTLIVKNRGHFTMETDINKIPEVLEELLKMTQ
ncbi:MAG: alpha/beta fold hydrolase [archaeon]